MRNRRYTKIKYNAKTGVYIAYQQGQGWVNECTIKCGEMPAPKFLVALRNLREHVIALCELPKDYKDRITVTSVSLNYGGQMETMGATITAQMELLNSNCPLNLNTPNKPCEPYNADQEWDDKTCLTDECVSAINYLEAAADEYLQGVRAQIGLFDSLSPEPPARNEEKKAS